MREIITNLLLFACLTLVLSSLSGCSGTTTANSGTGNIPQPPRIGGGNPNKDSVFPPLPSGLANSEMEMLDGTKVKIGDKKGKALVLNLWALWCGFCREEMPHLNQWQKDYGTSRLEIISLDVGDQTTGAPEPVDQIKKYLADNKLDYTTGRIGGDALRQFYMVTKNTPIPQTIMIDSDGRLRNVFVGGGQKNIEAMKAALEKIMID
jgi:thiol-disulfide isomerase/thioredoxin